jgi:hypothetical protein
MDSLSIYGVSDDVLGHIFSFLTHAERMTAAATHQRFYRISLHPRFWARTMTNEFTCNWIIEKIRERAGPMLEKMVIKRSSPLDTRGIQHLNLSSLRHLEILIDDDKSLLDLQLGFLQTLIIKRVNYALEEPKNRLPLKPSNFPSLQRLHVINSSCRQLIMDQSQIYELISCCPMLHAVLFYGITIDATNHMSYYINPKLTNPHVKYGKPKTVRLFSIFDSSHCIASLMCTEAKELCTWDCDLPIIALPSTLAKFTTNYPYLDVDLLYQQAPNLEELNLIEITAIRDREKVSFPNLKKLRILLLGCYSIPHSLIANVEELDLMRCGLDPEIIWDMPALRILALGNCENFTPGTVWNITWEFDKLIIKDSSLSYWDFVSWDQDDLIVTV